MKPIFLLLAVLTFPAFASDPTTANAPALPALENSVVKVFSTVRRPEMFKPWAKQTPSDISGSGVVIEGNRILTNAHVVAYASQVQVQANQAGDKLSATVVAVARGIDLAILKLDDESFFKTHAPAPRASAMPEVREAVFAYGYPTGGSSLSITKGIVSRIEFVPYSQSTAGLRIQVDAAINPGNSGGPAISGDKMIGLAFAQATNTQNIGYIIPNEEIDIFLHDVKDGRYDGKFAMLDEVQTLENPVLRAFLKLDKAVEGAVVNHAVSPELKEWDVITHVGDTPIDNEGMVKVNANLRVSFPYKVQQLAKDGKVPLTVVRAGKSIKVNGSAVTRRPRLVDDLNGAYPSYFVYGPMVFSRATVEFLAGIAGNNQALIGLAVAGNPLLTRVGDRPDGARDELVVVASPFFPHKTVKGYSSRFGAVLHSVNNVPIKSLHHLVATLRDLKDDTVIFRFEQRFGESMVVSRKDMLAATEEILSDNGIRSQASADMLEVWEGKAK